MRFEVELVGQCSFTSIKTSAWQNSESLSEFVDI